MAALEIPINGLSFDLSSGMAMECVFDLKGWLIHPLYLKLFLSIAMPLALVVGCGIFYLWPVKGLKINTEIELP